MVLSFFSGMVMEKMQSEAGHMQKFLVLIPLMNSQGGSIGSCVSSRLSTMQGQRKKQPVKRLNAERRRRFDVNSQVESGSNNNNSNNNNNDNDKNNNNNNGALKGNVSNGNAVEYVEAIHESSDFMHLLFLQTMTLTLCSCTVLYVVCGALFGYLFDSMTRLLYVMTLMAIVLTSVSTGIALLAIQASERFGLDADNVTVPVVCALMDSIARLAYFFV